MTKGYKDDSILLIKVPAQILNPDTTNENYIAIQKYIQDTLENYESGDITGIAHPEFIEVELIPKGGILTISGPSPIFDPKSKNPKYKEICNFIVDTIQKYNKGTLSSFCVPNFLTVSVKMPDKFDLENVKIIKNGEDITQELIDNGSEVYIRTPKLDTDDI